MNLVEFRKSTENLIYNQRLSFTKKFENLGQLAIYKMFKNYHIRV